MRPKTLGMKGEDSAARYLRKRGFSIVARRERDKTGEIDLIAVEDRTVVFVEVKTRSSHHAGHPSESVHEDKQRRMTRLALAYLHRHDLLECAVRFDVVAVTWPESKRHPVIQHYRNAFEATGRWQMHS